MERMQNMNSTQTIAIQVDRHRSNKWH